MRSATTSRAARRLSENLIEEELGRISGCDPVASRVVSGIGEALGIPARRVAHATMTAGRDGDGALDVWLAESKAVVRDLAGISLGSELFNPDAYVRVNRRAQAALPDVGMRRLLFFSVHVKVDKDHGDSSGGIDFSRDTGERGAETLWASRPHIEFMRRLCRTSIRLRHKDD